MNSKTATCESDNAIIEEIVDWVRQKNDPCKDSLETFSLSLTEEGLCIRDAVLNILQPAAYYTLEGDCVLIYSKLSRPTLLKLAHIAVARMHHDP
jgi:hypothetical protein